MARKGNQTISLNKTFQCQRDPQQNSNPHWPRAIQSGWTYDFSILLNGDGIGTVAFAESEGNLALEDIYIDNRECRKGIASAVVKWLALHAERQRCVFILQNIKSRWIKRIVEAEKIFAETPVREINLYGPFKRKLLTLKGRPSQN